MARRIGYTVKKMRSGRYQLVLRDPFSGKQIGMGTYEKRESAEKAGIEHISQQNKGTWIDPRTGEVTLQSFMDDWLDRQAKTGRHSERYQVLSKQLCTQHIYPFIGKVLLTDLRPSVVNQWHDRLVASRQPNVGLVPAKTYRLLHACLNDAVANEVISRNPAMKRDAGIERSPERPLLEPEQITALANAIVPWWSTLIYVSAYCALRFGECARLKREDVDLERAELHVRKAKTFAGIRTVSIPPPLIPLFEKQLASHDHELVFVGPKGAPLDSNFNMYFRRAADSLGLTKVRFHDLRHAGGTYAAQMGATERELMSRLGHASAATARRYQHAAARRDRELAERLGGMIGGL